MTIERAAKAIFEAKYGLEAWEDSGHSHAGRREQELYRLMASAALEAVAEPTPEMIEKARDLYCSSAAYDLDAFLQNMWRAMHAAMMNSAGTSAGNSRELSERQP